MTNKPVSAQIPSTDPTIVKDFVMGGWSTFTVVSNRTQARYTFKVSAERVESRDIKGGETIEEYRARKMEALKGSRSVLAMTGSDNECDYTPIGTITEAGGFVPAPVGSKMEGRLRGFAWFWQAVNEVNAKLTQCEVWHDGHCSCCGKKLSVPESLSSGIGPVCSYHKRSEYNPLGLNTHVGN